MLSFGGKKWCPHHMPQSLYPAGMLIPNTGPDTFSCKTPKENAYKVSRFLIKGKASITIQLINRYELNTGHVPSLRSWKKQSLELGLNQKQPGALLFQCQPLQGRRESRFLPSQKLKEYSFLSGEQRRERDGGNLES